MAKTNHKGITLVELVVSMAIAAFVMIMAISLLEANSRNYSYANDEVDLQIESQTVMNQLYDMIAGASFIELKESGNVKALIIYCSSETDVIFLNKTDKQLFLADNRTAADIGNLSGIHYTKEENLMAEYVADMSINPSDQAGLLNEKEIELTLKFEINTLTFSTSQNITFRNGLTVP